MRSFERQVVELYDLDPLWNSLAVAAERYGETTPHLLPTETTASLPNQRAVERDAEIGAFAARRREQIAALEKRSPGRANGLRAAWEAWWREHAPCTSESRFEHDTPDMETPT